MCGVWENTWTWEKTDNSLTYEVFLALEIKGVSCTQAGGCLLLLPGGCVPAFPFDRELWWEDHVLLFRSSWRTANIQASTRLSENITRTGFVEDVSLPVTTQRK
jgi:hypothetical protein